MAPVFTGREYGQSAPSLGDPGTLCVIFDTAISGSSWLSLGQIRR